MSHPIERVFCSFCYSWESGEVGGLSSSRSIGPYSFTLCKIFFS